MTIEKISVIQFCQIVKWDSEMNRKFTDTYVFIQVVVPLTVNILTDGRT